MKLKIQSITRIYNSLCLNRSVKQIHKELYDSTFKSFYVSLEFKKVFLRIIPQIKKQIEREENANLILPLPISKFDKNERNNVVYQTINKAQLDKQVNLIINKIARDYEASAKQEMIKNDKEKFKNEKKVFILLSRHKDSALDHAPYQGKLCYLENYENILEDKKTIEEVKEFIEKKQLFSFEWVLGKPVWFITRPNCRHFYNAIDTLSAMSVDVNTLLEKNKMDLAIGNRDVLQTIKHDTRKEWYEKKNIENIILTYQRRLELHKEMYKKQPSTLLKQAITKDKLLINKWKDYYYKNTTRK